MTLKATLKNGLGLLAITMVVMPTLATAKTKKAEKKIECRVTVDDGEVSVVKTINGKTVKTDEDDEDCNTKVKFLGKRGNAFNVNVEKMTNGGKKVKVMMMGDDDAFPMGEGMHVIANDDGDENVRVFMRKGMGHGGIGHAMNWFSKEVSGFGGMDNDLQFMFIDDDNKDLDLDKDGKVTEAEARKARDAKLKSYDKNRDGRLSLNEFQAYWLSKRHAQMVDAFQRLDEDGDAQVTGVEFAASAVSQAKRHERMMKFMAEHKAKSAAKPKKKSK